VPVPHYLAFVTNQTHSQNAGALGLGEAALASCVLRTVRLDDRTSVEDLIRFRDEHKMELARFRAAIGELTAELSKDYATIEAFQQAVRDLIINKVQPAISELHHSRLRLFRTTAPAFLKAVAFTTAPAIVAQASLGPGASALTVLGGSAMYVMATLAKYRADREELLMKSPYSFVLSARATFGARLMQ
jgi:hypothetical protein